MRGDTRENVRAIVGAMPGATAAEVARAASVDRTTATYHLRRLAREGEILREAGRHYERGAVPARERLALVARRERAPLLAAVRASPGASKSGLARALGVPRATLAWQLAALEKAGLVRCERRGREVLVLPA